MRARPERMSLAWQGAPDWPLRFARSGWRGTSIDWSDKGTADAVWIMVRRLKWTVELARYLVHAQGPRFDLLSSLFAEGGQPEETSKHRCGGRACRSTVTGPTGVVRVEC